MREENKENLRLPLASNFQCRRNRFIMVRRKWVGVISWLIL